MTTSTATQILIADAKEALRRHIARTTQRTPAIEAFVAWSLRAQTPLQDLPGLAEASAARVQAERTYQHVAVLGFAAHTGGLDETGTNALRQGLGWLSGRSPIVDGEPMGFCLDAPALLGMALGAEASGKEFGGRVRSWLATFLRTSYDLPAVGDWQRCLLTAVDALLDVGLDLGVPAGPGVADVRTFLRARSLLPPEDQATTERDERDALLALRTQEPGVLSLGEAAMRLAAVDWIQRSAPNVVPGRADVRHVGDLLRHVPDGLRRWTWETDNPRTRGGERRFWHVDHEYHVQNLLYFLLAPIFPDLKDEEHTPSVGQKHPRTDLFIPSLKLIVEVKFMRSTDKPQTIIGQIAEDAGLYLAKGSDYTGIVAFVWDDSRRSEEHGKLIEGLRSIAGVADAVVISKPGAMT